MNQWLVSFDTDRIKEYVFATDKLKEIRGASELLNELNDEGKMETLITSFGPGCESIFFGGGSGAVKAPSREAAEALIAGVEKLYRQKTVTASISGASVPWNSETDHFGKRMEAAGFQLRRVKDEKARRLQNAIEPFTQPCQACERYPAARVVESAPLCRSCALKRERGSSIPREFEDFESLGGKARPSGYIGFIYADGNNMGELLTQLADAQAYKTLADGLRNLVAGAVGAIKNKEVLLAGGDDLIMVTTGNNALPAAVHIARYFEEVSQSLLKQVGATKEKCTLSVAVVLAHATFPITAFRNLAEQLLKNAKRKCAEEGYTTSVIDFMVVTSAGSSSVSTQREDVLSEKSFVFQFIKRKIRLTQRPYTLDDMDALIQHAQSFKNIPQSQLQFLYEGLFHSQAEASYRWGRVAGRKKEFYQPMSRFYERFGDQVGGRPPWKHGEDDIVYTSALGDLIELYRFV